MTDRTTQPRAGLALAAGIAFCFGFAALAGALAQLLPAIPFAPDTGAAHYYWQLPTPTAWTRAAAWTGYLLHQVTIWALIWYAQRSRLGYTAALHPVNVAALGANAFFVLLHLGQTHLTYDGLAQDVSIWTSFGSVALLLVIVLIMENRRRGLFFGHPVAWLNEPGRALRKYHGYYFAWAVIYTFWYHPMEGTLGHVAGTFYTALLMLQGSLFFTRVHTNRWWTVTLEVLVIVHGTLVAMMQDNGMWPMFLFGFAAIFIVTQMHGLGLPRWLRWGFALTYFGAVAATYATVRTWSALPDVLRIPITDYVLVFLIAALVWAGMVGTAKLRGRDGQPAALPPAPPATLS